MRRPSSNLELRHHPAQSVHRYLSPSFREELRRKAYRHLVNADFHWAADGERFPKDLTDSSLYGAVRALRAGTWQLGTAGVMLESNPQAEAVVTRYILEALVMDQPGRLRDLATMLELCGPWNRDTPFHIPWTYYAASTALSYLDSGRVPTKRQVMVGAIRTRAEEEIVVAEQPTEMLGAKIEELTKHRSSRTWAHIFRLLNLQELPV